MRNPVIKDLKKNKIISDKNLEVLSNKVRNKKNIKVFQDKVTKVIFLEKFLTGKNHFAKQDIYKKKGEFNLKINGKIKKLKRLKDDIRRKKQFNKLTKNKIICDYGCGDGNFIKKIDNAKIRYALDINKNNSTYFKKKITFVKTLSEIKTKLDVVFLFHSLHYIPEQIKILKELNKKMNKKGLIIIEVPNAKDFLLQNDITQEFKKFSFHMENLIWHTQKSLKKFLECAGFKKIKINFFQRHDINNHLNWIINNSNNYNSLKYIKNKKQNYRYQKKLINCGQSDTLIAVAQK
jgi:SAM-dependent methyltransferase